jgi:branched-chain amino acid transport system ATP-binding protein
MTALLSIEGLATGYGDFQALFDLDLRVEAGQTVAVIGANGAGKTTLLRAIAGQVPVWAGSISFDGADLGSVPAHKRVLDGIAMVPEGRMLFGSLTVRENLEVGAYGRRPGDWTVARVLEVFPLLEPLLGRAPSGLSGGERQAVAIGRALMANPRLILLDEVSLGLAPIVVRQVYGALPAITGAGATALVVEQDIGQALAVADRVVCLLEGRASLEGDPDSLDRQAIAAAYFGLGTASTIAANGGPDGIGSAGGRPDGGVG